jgi:hypothetical protein
MSAEKLDFFRVAQEESYQWNFNRGFLYCQILGTYVLQRLRPISATNFGLMGADTFVSQAIIRHELTQINPKKEK